MRQARRIIFIFLAGIAVLVFAWEIFKPREPSYHGKTLTEWLKIASHSETIQFPDEPSEAADAIRHIGTNGIPTLLKLAATKDSQFNVFWEKFSAKVEGLTSVKFPHPDLSDQTKNSGLRNLAEGGFFILGSDSKPAIPKLIVLLKDENNDVSETAIECLWGIGPAAEPAVPDLVKILEKYEAYGILNFSVLMALNRIAPSARAAIPALTKTLALSHDGQFKNFRADQAIAQAALIKMQAASLSPVLEQLKNTSDVTNWIFSSAVVQYCGTNGGTSAAVPLLVTALNHTNKSIQFRALFTLKEIHQSPEISIPALVPFLESTNKNIRVYAAEGIHRFYKDAKPAVPALIRCLNDSSPSVRSEVTNALRAIDPEAAAKAGIK